MVHRTRSGVTKPEAFTVTARVTLLSTRVEQTNNFNLTALYQIVDATNHTIQ